MNWDFKTHTGDTRLKLRDHGTEIIVGLVLQFALEAQLGSPRAAAMQPALKLLLDRLLASANADGLLYNTIDTRTLAPIDSRLSDNWGYLYGALYGFYQITGETRYRDATIRVLTNLPKYRNYCWEPSGNARTPALRSGMQAKELRAGSSSSSPRTSGTRTPGSPTLARSASSSPGARRNGSRSPTSSRLSWPCI